MVNHVRQTKKTLTNEDIPIRKWKKRLALVPDEVIKKMLGPQHSIISPPKLKQDKIRENILKAGYLASNYHNNMRW